MLRRLILIFAMAGVWLATPHAMAQSEDKKLSLSFDGLVADDAGVLSPTFKQDMKERLPQIKRKSGISIVLVTVPRLQGTSSGKLANDVGEKLQNLDEIGKHWVVFVLSPVDREFSAALSSNNPAAAKALQNEERSVMLEFGKSFAQIFTDAVTPYFKESEWEAGLRAGVDALHGFAAPQSSEPTDELDQESPQVA